MKVLIADDGRIARRRLEAALLGWGYNIVIASDGAEAWQALVADGSIQIAILDWMMPGMDGPEICRKVRQQLPEPHIYVLLVTSRGETQDIVDGMEAGADDYLVKPFNSHELRARLGAGRRIVKLQSALISAREALRHQATHDSLTGAWNRTAIMDALRKELARASREGRSVAVVMADIDHFKRVNDTYGHRAGDAVLREVVRRMRACLRPYDDIGRYGGEEFMIVLGGNSTADAAAVAERVRAGIAQDPENTFEATIPVTISFGVASTDEGDAADVESLIQSADMALYRAKEHGRNRVEAAVGDDAMVDGTLIAM